MQADTTTKNLDQTKVEAFAECMVDVLNHASLSLMISIGHKIHLFDTMENLPPSTSEQIAQASNLHERYVREWLGAMVTGRIIEYDAEHRTYWLPMEHATSLSRSAGPANIALQHQYIVLQANVQDEIITCFHQGGGVPYSLFPQFQQIMAEESAQVVDTNLLQTTLPLIPGLVERLRQGIDVADFGCGSGHAINVMAQAFPNSRFTGYDISPEGIANAQDETIHLGLTNTRFEVQDVSCVDMPEHYDLITAFDAIHDQAKPQEVLQSISNSLRRQGIFLMVDIAASSNLQDNMDLPLAPFLYTISCNHCMTVSLASDGKGLGTVWGEQLACEMLRKAGFTHINMKHIEDDIINVYYIASKD